MSSEILCPERATSYHEMSAAEYFIMTSPRTLECECMGVADVKSSLATLMVDNIFTTMGEL